MKIFIGADHNGFVLKSKLVDYLKRAGYNVVDYGNSSPNPDDDYPVLASRVMADMLSYSDPDSRAILLCGSGQGMAIAANRHKGVRAAVCWDAEQARLARNDDDVNVLALPAYILEKHTQTAQDIVEAFLRTPFARAARYVRRVKELDSL